jgi:hypothetical protein
MGKYKVLQDDIFSIFAGAAWKAEKIETQPTNYVGNDVGDEYIVVTIIPSGPGANRVSVSGVMLIDIYTSFGEGPLRANLIADKLDQYLSNKTLATITGKNTQCFDSNMTPRGQDKDNPTLHRSLYSIPFKFFGVL